MKHRASTAPASARHVAVNAVVRARQEGGSRAGHGPRHARPESRRPGRHAAPADPRAAITGVGVGLSVLAATTLGAGQIVAAAPAVSAGGAGATGALGVHSPANTAGADATGGYDTGGYDTDGYDTGGYETGGYETTGASYSDGRYADAGDERADGTTTPYGGTSVRDAAEELRQAHTALASTGRVSRDAQRPVAAGSTRAMQGPAWQNPLPSAGLTSCFGPRWGTLHAGIDLAGPSGTPVHAAGAGRVVAAGWNYSGYGISVMIDHGNGYLTHYAHLSKALVHPGQKVAAGQVIGKEGSTGDSTGPHLHFEVHKGQWHQVDPAPWLRAHGVRIGC